MSIQGFHTIGPKTCLVCNMPRGLEPDRAFLMGLLMAHRFIKTSAQVDATVAFSASMGLCPRHNSLLAELTPIRPTGERVR